MGALRIAVRLPRLVLALMLGVMMASLIGLAATLGGSPSSELRQRWTQRFMQGLLAALPFELKVVGQLPQRPVLWVSNHVSWTDIPVLGAVAPLTFLSKDEVRHWPVAGWLARHAGTLFLRRGAGDSQRLREEMASHLSEQRDVLLFPEGTTTDGQDVRTFHGRLLGSAIDTETPVQPVALRYLRDGEPDALAPFVGDDDMLPHLMRLLRAERAVIEVHLLPPIDSQGRERAALAFLAQQSVRQVLLAPDSVPLAEPVAA